MGALLDHAAFVEYGDLVAEFAGGESVADVDCGLVACDVVEFAVDFCLGNWVESSCGFIKNDEWCVFVESPCDGYFLGFSTGYIKETSLNSTSYFLSDRFSVVRLV